MKPPSSSTLSSQNETLNTSQSVNRAAKIETDPLFHYYTTKLILLTTRRIRYDKWLQRWKQAARADDSPSVRRHGLNSDCQLFIWVRWKRILVSSTASGFCSAPVGDSDLPGPFVTCQFSQQSFMNSDTFLMSSPKAKTQR